MENSNYFLVRAAIFILILQTRCGPRRDFKSVMNFKLQHHGKLHSFHLSEVMV